jgi:sugar lactone lactonase YvrE
LGEGPVWDAATQTLCWVDILGGRIHEYTPVTEAIRTLEVGEMVGSVALCTDGNYLAALHSGIYHLDRVSGRQRMLTHPASHRPENRYNEGKCDPAGRFWVGTMALSEAPHAGSLYMIDTDGAPTRKVADVTISNGLAWSADHRTLYYIDSPTRAVVAYDFDRATGAITNPRPVIELPAEQGFPDGMTIDRDGMLWIAHWDGWQVSRWDPRTGGSLQRISLPTAQVTSCTFGGKNLEDLYITTARTGLTEEQLAEQPLAGSLFVVENCGYRGLVPDRFDFR